MQSLATAAVAAFFLGAVASPAQASERSHRDLYLTIKGEPKVTMVEETSVPSGLLDYSLRAAPAAQSEGGLTAELGDISQIINLGKQIWDIIAANKPVVNIQVDTANALPQDATGWTDLQGWQMPSSRLYRFTYENLYGMNVVDFSYRVLYSYGGNARGKGKYLANVTVVPADLSVTWGYTFNAKVSIPAVLNAGSTTDPVGAVQMLVDWKIDTVVKHVQSSQSYYVRGDGAFQDLSSGN